ncbi:hypothetical protein PPL_01987 [Heterostelium album PN500]|uniref:Uncharacterized protein n=1 Tax=Heterostelium pallidum (strain ATCC 26659 / Pp 5 / PN500) TaxID=670386 RepID=D3B119_HETP5|nr:hypothetical protein PPL_01987 [Heterostelium album PN500]EFA84993.1 hypothetical protein PPL_01987 [Heterostelium album PN500]|eukprot:XP_020437103.1 hypothetical protein PPL_01987 [Heterostelium album PN500]
MTTKEILDKLQIYNRDELKELKRDELVKLMVKYSLKHGRKKKDVLIDSILEYQEHINDIKSKLITNNPIEQYHRGTVEYRLPTLIIYRIIRDLWYEDIHFCQNIDLRSNYRWLLSIALVSKEFFKLISSLFNRFAIKPNPRQTKKDTISFAKHLRKSFLNPHSVLKRISDITLPSKVFSEIIKKSISAPFELGLIFNNVRRFCMFNDIGNWRDNSIKIPQCKSIIEYMPNIESLVLNQLHIDRNRILSDQHQLTTFGVGRINFAQFQVLSGHFMNITKLIIYTVYGSVAEKFEELLCLPDCKVRTLITDSRCGWVKRVLSKNQLIDTIDINYNLDETFNFLSKSPSIKRFIFNNSNRITDYRLTTDTRATGFAHVKSKSQIYRVASYAVKIYNVSENQDDNAAVESTYPHLKFLYASNEIVSSDPDSNFSNSDSDFDSDLYSEFGSDLDDYIFDNSDFDPYESDFDDSDGSVVL